MTTFLAPGVQVLLRSFAVGEEPRRLEHDVDPEIGPRKRSRVALREDPDLLARRAQDSVGELDVAREGPEVRVVTEQVRHRLRIPQVVQGDDLQV